MAPSAIDVDIPVVSKGVSREPLKLSGALDTFEAFDVTPVIGREFPTANLTEWLTAPNSDELLRDLAITSEFVYFRWTKNKLTNKTSFSAWRRFLPRPGWPDQRSPEAAYPASW